MNINTARVLQHMGFVVLVDFVAHQDGPDSVRIQWLAPQPQPTPAEISAAEPLAIAAWEAAEAERAQAAADRAELREQFQAAHARLVQIRDGTNPTNAQVIAGMKDIAGYQLKILRALYGMLTD